MASGDDRSVSPQPSLASTKALPPAGAQPAAVYERSLSRGRFAVRKMLIRSLEAETPILARMQRRFRRPLLDSYLVVASLTGTHTFFMLGLPLLCWFGTAVACRRMCFAVGLGTIITSWVKDLYCVPRPASPPVVRLSVGNHAAEYGFPSTHSTNTASIALVLAEYAVRAEQPRALLAVELAALVVYVASVVGGRMMCGMHSAMDCLCGFTLGVICWALVSLYGDAFDAFLQTGLPAMVAVVSASLLCVITFPQPVDDCPCAEDAFAFIGTLVGIAGGVSQSAFDNWPVVPQKLLGASREPLDIALGFGLAAGKVLFGYAALLIWRAIAKKTLHIVLPPLIRTVEPIVSLPRRHYKRASEYISYDRSQEHLTSVPSVIAANLPSENPIPKLATIAKTRPGGGRLRALSNATTAALVTPQRMLPPSERKPRYDADVLTKLLVYTGVGWLATHGIPAAFTHLETSF